ncbi:MAG: hypothetical protein WAV93_11535 [Bacteroidales bacterium]
MVGELNFNLLDPNAPAKAAGSIYEGQAWQQANELAQAQLQHAQSQNELSKYTLGAAKRSDEQQNQLNAMMQNGFDPTNPAHVNRLYGMGPAGQAMIKTIQESQKNVEDLKGKKVKTAKDIQDFMNQGKRDISDNPSDANVTAWTEDAVRKGFFTPEQGQASLAHMMSMTPMERISYLGRQGATAGDISSAASAAAGRDVTMRGQDIGSATARRGQDIGASTAAAGRGVQMRGQDIGASTAAAALAAKVSGAGLKPVPVHAQKAIIGASTAVKKIDDAIAALEGKAGAESTGLKGYLPDVALNRMYPEGTEARAAVADIGSLIMHDRSGAAVTASESPRLKPFIPLVTDDKATALKKLKRMRQVQVDDAEALASAYVPEQGFREFKPGGNKPAPAAGALSPAEQAELAALKAALGKK